MMDLKTWAESPDINIDRSTSYRYIRLFEVYVDSGAFELSEVQDKSISKLEALIPYVVDLKAKDWPDRKAQLLSLCALSRKHLIETLNGAGDNRYAPVQSSASNRNAAGSMAVTAGYEVTNDGSLTESHKLSKASKDADAAFSEVVAPAKTEEVVPSAEATKKIGLSGWYEMVPTAEPPSGKGKVSKGVFITTESVIVTGNRIFVNVE